MKCVYVRTFIRIPEFYILKLLVRSLRIKLHFKRQAAVYSATICIGYYRGPSPASLVSDLVPHLSLSWRAFVAEVTSKIAHDLLAEVLTFERGEARPPVV